MDYKDDLDKMDLSSIETDYDAKRVKETPHQKNVRKALNELKETTESLKENQIMQSKISYMSAKAIYEREQNKTNVVFVPVPRDRM